MDADNLIVRERGNSTPFARPVLVGSFLLAAGWFPWSQSPGIDGKFLALHLWGLIVLSFLSWAMLTGRPFRQMPKRFSILIGVLMLGALLSTLLSMDIQSILGSTMHREGFVTFLLYGLTFFAFAYTDLRPSVRTLARALMAAVVFNGMIGFTLSGAGSAEFFGNRFVGSFAEPSFLAGWLVMAIPLIAYAAISAPSRIEKVAAAAVGALAVFELAASQSRTGYLGLAAGATVAIFLYALKDRKLALKVSPAAILILIPLLSSRFSPASLAEGILSRVSTWSPFLMTGRYVLAGAGPDQFRVISNNRFRLWGAHNSYINDAAEIGWVASAAFLLLIGAVLLALYRRTRESDTHKAEPMIWLASAISGYAVFSFGNYTRPYVTLWLWILLGLGAAVAGSGPKGTWRPAVELKAVLISMALVLSVVLLIAGVRLSVGSYHFRAFTNVPEAASIADHWRPLNQAVLWEPYNQTYRNARATVALELMDAYYPDIERFSYIRRHAVEDWEFLLTRAYNDKQTYEQLRRAYRYAATPEEDWLPAPRY